MKTILLPTEFSPEDRPVIEYATRLVGEVPARFVLVHARPLPDSGTPLQLAALQGRSYRSLDRQQQREFSYLCRTYAHPDRIFLLESSSGSLSFLLSRCISDHAADMIVMRKQPENWLERNLPALGNRQLRMAARLPVPVLFVPDRAPAKPPRDIALFTTPSATVETAQLQPLYELANRYGADITGYTLAGERPVRYELALDRIGNGGAPGVRADSQRTEPVNWADLFDRSAPDLLVTTRPRNAPLSWLGQEPAGVRLAKQHAVPLLML